MRGVNWAPDSDDEYEESKVHFVQDTYAGETEVPDT